MAIHPDAQADYDDWRNKRDKRKKLNHELETLRHELAAAYGAEPSDYSRKELLQWRELLEENDTAWLAHQILLGCSESR